MKHSQDNILKLCKYCGSAAVVKFGVYGDVQRYWCKSCRRKFTGGNVFYSRVPADIIGIVLEFYYSGERVADIRNYLKQERCYYPAESTIYEWIAKYTALAKQLVKDNKPYVSSSWLFDENIIKVNGKNNWLLDIADSTTRYLLATQVLAVRSPDDVPALLEQACRIAGKKPESLTYCKTPEESQFVPGYVIQNRKYVASLQSQNPFLVHRFDKTYTKRTRMRYFKNGMTAAVFNADWALHYNYFQTNDSLDGLTPAEAAKVQHPFKTWTDFVKHTAMSGEGLKTG